MSQSPGVYSAANRAPYLAGTGSLLRGTPVATNPTNLSYSISSGGHLTPTWPATHIGWRLEAQTNSLATGLSTNWFTLPGSTATNLWQLPVDPANNNVFYRLIYP